jgi:hypothetical protein
VGAAGPVDQQLLVRRGRRVIEHRWNPVQSRFLLAAAAEFPYVDLEGAVRAGKTTPLVAKIAGYCVDFPGIHCALTRWTQDGLDAQLKPRWRDWCHQNGIALRYHTDEEYDEVVATGSRVYLRALKASEQTNRYGKLAGLTLAVLGIDQPEEVPADVYRAFVPARLSQVGYPHQVLLTPNPPGETHWLADDFPVSNTHAGHLYLRTSVYDNRHNLGDAYIESLEAAYPAGHALRRRFIEGKRGLATVGDPVYASTFNPNIHVGPTRLNPHVPLLEGWDFGHKHPHVIWAQVMPWGQLVIHGGIMGVDQFIEDFAPAVVAQRATWFWPEDATDDGLPFDVMSTGDPAGDQNNSQGTSTSAADILREHGISLYTIPGANHIDARDRCIQHVAGYQRRLTRTGPAFYVDPDRWLLLASDGPRFSTHFVDALEAGYVWDDRVYTTSLSPNTRRPRKDGFYDHGMNCLEYVVLAYGPAQPSKVDAAKAERLALARSQRDLDPVGKKAGQVKHPSRYGGTRRVRSW